MLCSGLYKNSERKMLTLNLFSFSALQCFHNCASHKRFCFSCIRCPTRRVKDGKLKNCHFNKTLQKWIPNKNHLLSMLLFEDSTICYILFVDEQRNFKAAKDVLVNALFSFAEKANLKGKIRFRAKLLSLAEFLA